MKFHDPLDEGPPCRNMEGLLQRTADGTANRFARWYALAHAARCTHCYKFLQRLEATIRRVREVKNEEPSDDVRQRLANGAWREELK